jgi:hypothetical protein
MMYSNFTKHNQIGYGSFFAVRHGHFQTTNADVSWKLSLFKDMLSKKF